MKTIIAFLLSLSFTASIFAATPALDEVNRQRSARGLSALPLDPGLQQAAEACAEYRAARRIEGHTANDFSFVPRGSTSNCAGCAAWASGFGACSMFERHAAAGAAYAIGPDGKRYCHVFYR